MGNYKKFCLCLVTFISLFFGINNANAYTYIGISASGEDNLSYYNPSQSGTDISGITNWWLIDAGQYFSVGAVNGEYLNIGADYTIKIHPTYYPGGNTINWYSNYLNSSRNVLTPNNLRCGIGDYKTGYDGTYAPTITNFSITQSKFESYGYQFRIQFNYSQRINKVNKQNQNASCWFVRNPSDGLILQYISNSYSTMRLYGITNSLNYSVSNDPNTQLLEESLTAQRETNNKLNQTNEKLDSLSAQTNETNKKLDETNDTLKDSDSDEATNEAGSFFSGFETDTFGLTSIITAPLNLIESVTSSTCVPMGLPIPFIEGQTLNLPCLRGIYENHFGVFYDIYKTITFGIVAYWVCVRLFNLVKDFKNPEHDEIEVLEL